MLLETFIFQELIQNRSLLVHCPYNTKKLLDSRRLDWTRLGRCAPPLTLESDWAQLDSPGLCWWVHTLTVEGLVQSHASLCGICCGQSGTGTSVCLATSVFPCQYQPTNPPYSFIHLLLTLYVFLPVLRFTPVSIIPPMLSGHSFIYHRRCIMFLSQYSGFPVSIIPPTLHTHTFIYH
jgi:hypothetical protein